MYLPIYSFMYFCFSQVEPTVGEESRSEGTVALGLYVKYYRAGANVFMLLVLVLLNLLAHVSMCSLWFG